MNKSKIEWCDMTWNPVTGCFHKCQYCYAEKIANRFGMLKNGVSLSETEEILKYIYGLDGGTDYEIKGECIELSTPIGCEMNEPFPFNFRPTLYKYRLHEPERKKKPQRIFVCSMADLFGEWVPDEWIRSVADACRQASHHKYLFLTKNPAGYRYGMHTMFGNGFWLGTTINTQQDISRHSLEIMNTPGNLFLSIEPIHGWVDLTKVETPDGGAYWNALTGEASVPFTMLKKAKISWVIIGAETGPGAKTPPFTWVINVVNQCRTAGVPVFLKENLCKALNLKGVEIIQEYPEELQF